MTETAKAVEATETEASTKKSIVPAKYSGKYKGAGDAVAEFIKEQITGKDGVEFTALFALCRANGIDEAKVKHYEGLYADKANNHGIEGRARMTLGNMLRAKARKEGKLNSIAGEETTFEGLAKPAVSGAAAKAQENAAEAETQETTTEETAVSEEVADETTE